VEKLRWGVLGTGNIVGKGGPALRSSNGEWIGIAGRNPENGAKAAEKFGVPKSYAGYRELLEDPEIDAVYIALLNHLHKEWAIEAIKAGKHVLLEKPFTMNARDAEEVVNLAKQHGVHVEEAFVWRRMEGHLFAHEAVSSGKIGDPVFFRGHFSFQANENSTRLVEEWGGGAMYDLGCYLVSWSRFHFREEPDSADCRMIWKNGTRVDLRFAGSLQFPGGGTAHMTGALDMPYGCGYEIKGTAGSLEVWQFADQSQITLQVTVNGEYREFTTDRVTPFRLQAERFAERVLSGEKLADGGRSILAQARAMDALFASAESGNRVKIAQG